MAVENKYVNQDIVDGKKAVAAFVQGSKPIIAVTTFEVAVADDDGSIYRIIKNIAPDLIPVRFEVTNDAITGGTDFDLGLYRNLDRGGAVIDGTVFLNAVSMAAARAHSAPLDGLSALDIANVQRRIYEHAGDTLDTRELGYDIAYIGNIVGAAAGTITTIMWFVQG